MFLAVRNQCHQHTYGCTHERQILNVQSMTGINFAKSVLYSVTMCECIWRIRLKRLILSLSSGRSGANL